MLAARVRSLRKLLFPTTRQLLVGRSLRRLELADEKEVLVVGAGRDPYRYLFTSATKYVRLDIEPTEGFTDVVADAHDLPFEAAHFDCVFAAEVAEHLHTPQQFADEAHRVLRPGGKVVISVPFMFHRHADPFDFWRPTPDALKRTFGKFSSVQIWHQGTRLHSMFDLLTTSFWPWSPFFPLRLLSPLLAMLPGAIGDANRTTAPSGYMLLATK